MIQVYFKGPAFIRRGSDLLCRHGIYKYFGTNVLDSIGYFRITKNKIACHSKIFEIDQLALKKLCRKDPNFTLISKVQLIRLPRPNRWC